MSTNGDSLLRWVRRSRYLLILELILSVVFNVALMVSITRGKSMNILLTIVIALNVLTAARLLTKLHGFNCASSITAYIVWKILQEIIMLPVLVFFSFVWIDRYMKSWSSSFTGIQVLLIMWLYAVYSFFLVIYLGSLARCLWSRKSSDCCAARKEKRDSQDISVISFISTSAVGTPQTSRAVVTGGEGGDPDDDGNEMRLLGYSHAPLRSTLC